MIGQKQIFFLFWERAGEAERREGEKREEKTEKGVELMKRSGRREVAFWWGRRREGCH